MKVTEGTKSNTEKRKILVTININGIPRLVSSLPPLAIERKTLVEAGHVTTQNLGGKKSVGQLAGRVAELFVSYYDKLRGFQNCRAVAKYYPLKRDSKSVLPIKNATLHVHVFLPSPKYRRVSSTKKFGSQMEHKLFVV